MLARFGQTITLRRVTAVGVNTDCQVPAYTPRATPANTNPGDVRQLVEVVALGPDIPAGWPAPPAKRDQVLIDGRWMTVESVASVGVGAANAGWDLTVKGA